MPIPVPDVEGPIPGSPPGDPESDDIAQTYPFFSTDADLGEYGYVEEEFFISGTANQYEGGEVASEHPYKTRVVVRRPAEQADSNGDVLMEWQNVSAGYDIDALWSPSPDHIMRSGYTWVGVSAQNVGVSQLTEWSPTRYGDLDVTDGGTVEDDQLSYDVFSQAAQAVRADENSVMGGIEVDQVLAIGASQSAGRMTVYYDDILPHIEPVFDGYGYMVGNAPQDIDRSEPVFQVLSETDAARTADPRRTPTSSACGRSPERRTPAGPATRHGRASRTGTSASGRSTTAPSRRSAGFRCRTPSTPPTTTSARGPARERRHRPPSGSPATTRARSPATRAATPRAASSCPRSRSPRR